MSATADSNETNTVTLEFDSPIDVPANENYTITFYTFFTCNKPPGCDNDGNAVSIKGRKSADEDYDELFSTIYDGNNKAQNQWNRERVLLLASDQDYKLHVILFLTRI